MLARMIAAWRDGASPRAGDDLDALVNVGLDVAQRLLNQHSEFCPFAVAMTIAGEVEMIDAVPGAVADRPGSVEVIDACVAQLAERRAGLRAAAVVCDVRCSELNTDAIDVALEHAEGAAFAVQLPYTHRRLHRRVEYGQLYATAGTARIWTGS
jgi:hypothetical protein